MFFTKKKITLIPGPLKDVLARKMAARIIAFREALVKRLERIDRKLSTSQKKMALAVYCLVFGAYLLYVLARAVVPPGNHALKKQPSPAKQVKESANHKKQ